MTLPVLSTRDRRALRFGAFAGLLVLVWLGVVGPCRRAAADLSARLETERDLLRRELGVLRSAGRTLIALEEGAGRLVRATPRLFASGADGGAAAALGEYVWERGRASHVLFAELEAMPGESVGSGVLTVPLRVRGEGDLEGLLFLLARLEAGPRLVLVDRLRVQAGQQEQRGARGAGWETLTFEFAVTGFTLDERSRRETGPASQGRVEK